MKRDSILVRIRRKSYYLLNRYSIILTLLFKSGKTLYLFGYPIHPNIGDQAQAYCIEEWLKKNYPGYGLVRFNYSNSFTVSLKLLRLCIGREDRIFFHSGYHLIDYHLELPVYCKVVELFPDYEIVFFPQTINFLTVEKQKEVSRVFNAHPRLLLLCRDEISYTRAKELFPRCNLLLFPDIVTSMIGTRKYSNERKGILLCVRDDIESRFSPAEIGLLRKRLETQADVKMADTTIAVSRWFLENNRKRLIDDMIEQFASFELVVTDRYHGTILSLVAGTPVIVIPSTDHKVSSGVKWFPREFENYVFFVEDIGLVPEYANTIIKHHQIDELPAFFLREFYMQLKEKIDAVM